jgi:hypothetical protein
MRPGCLSNLVALLFLGAAMSIQPASPSPAPTVNPSPTILPTARPTPRPTPTPRPLLTGGLWHTSQASWYGSELYGHHTACGEVYGPNLLEVANKTLPCGTLVEFKYKGRIVRAPVLDRGPYVAGREWDLSAALCQALNHCFTGGIQWRLVNP